MPDLDAAAALAAHFDQVRAHGEDLRANDPGMQAAYIAYGESMVKLAGVMLDAGIAREGLMGAMLTITVELTQAILDA